MPETVLITEDDHHIAELLTILLESKGYSVLWAKDGETSLEMAQAHNPDLILLDVMLPRMNGFDVLKQLKTIPAVANIPVIFVTVQAATDNKVVGLKLGGNDYITKPFDIEELLARVESVLRIKHEHKNLNTLNQRLAELSVTDPLTGLYNRRFLQERLKEEVDRAKRYQYPIACLIFDLDDFKRVNETLGHMQGDQLLQKIALILKNSSRVVDIVGRFGGEEFLLVLPQTDLGGAKAVGERIRKLVADKSFFSDDPQRRVTLSAGVAAFSTDKPKAPEDLLQWTEDALCEAKRQGKNQVSITTQS